MIVVCMLGALMITPFIFMLLYFDDMLVVANHLYDKWTKIMLEKEFDMKDLGSINKTHRVDIHIG